MSQIAEVPRSQQVVPMRTGGAVAAVVPQSIKEIWEVARGVVASGLAPKNLSSGDDKVSAVAITIMAGMELGLKPMVALRSFTVINGKPALYGDGLINVVRGSGKVKKLRTGCDIRDGKMVGWCEASRLDTGEESRVEFSQDDAIQAGLWSPDKLIRKEVWENRAKVWKDNVPNDAPWHRYPQRMLAWRAAGWCLRELFGDVLGGIRDEFEAQEIHDAEILPVIAPPPPEVDDAPIIDEDPEAVTGEQDFDAAAFFEDLEIAMTAANDEEAVEAAWSELDVEAALTSDETNLEVANKIKARALKRISEAQDGMFPGGLPPETAEAVRNFRG